MGGEVTREFGALPSYFAGYAREGPGYRQVREVGLDNWLLIATLSGGGRITLRGGETFEVGPGETLRYRPRAHNDYGLSPLCDHWEMLWVHTLARPDWTPFLDWPELGPPEMRSGEARSGVALCRPADPERVHARLRAAVEATRGHGLLDDLAGRNAIEEALLLCRRSLPTPVGKGLDERVARAVSFVAKGHAHPDLGVPEIAAAAGLSPSRLTELFRAELGESPRAHIERVRMERARAMLTMTALPIAAVAARAGYENPFRFSTRFRAATGMTPTEYRRRS